jgi:hypothetical protein
MENLDLARTKLDRAIRLASRYDDLTESDLRALLLCLLRSIDSIPHQNSEKLYWYAKINSLLNMELNRYGEIFKATNWKNSVIINKNNLEEMVLNVNCLLYQ